MQIITKREEKERERREKKWGEKQKFDPHSSWTRGRGSIYRVIGQLNDWMAAFWRNFARSNSRRVFSLSHPSFNRLSFRAREPFALDFVYAC